MRKSVSVTLLVLILVAGFAGGYFFGQRKGMNDGKAETEKKLSPVVELAFPKPPAMIKSLTGAVKDVVGGTIYLEINDPDDYLPHLDGSARTKELRYADLSSATKILSIDNSKTGLNRVKTIKLSDIKTGDTITVRSDENIRDAQKFDAMQVERVLF